MTTSDVSLFYSSLASDPDMAEMVEMFVDEMHDRVERLEELLRIAEWEELGRFAHQLKGACGSYGFAELTPLAERLEKVVRGSEAEDVIQDALQSLAQGFRGARAGRPD
jgi:HPt (histidine-containing phosphotransfer) domain-containing protein